MNEFNMNRQWMKEIQKIFNSNTSANKILTTSDIQKYMKKEGAGPNQTSGAINTALEIGLIERVAYGKYKLKVINKKKSSDIYQMVSQILDNTKEEINKNISLSSLDEKSFVYIKNILNSLDKLKN